MTERQDIMSFDEFLRLKLKVAKVLEAVEHPDADKLLVLKIDLGTEQRQIVAGIKKHYKPEELVGKNETLLDTSFEHISAVRPEDDSGDIMQKVRDFETLVVNGAGPQKVVEAMKDIVPAYSGPGTDTKGKPA